MQKHRLIPHPDMPHPSITLAVEVSRLRGTGLRLWYVVNGAIDVVRFPALGEPARADGLWQATCFEVFFRNGDSPAYDEINLTSSRQWAAYSFDTYREGMRSKDMDEPQITVATWADTVAVGADFDAGAIVARPNARFALSAVIEEIDGTKSYWALRHPPGKPDFHHPDCFALELPLREG
ncbi:DOMON-like domain-containing protein [Sphingomonas suaedae]|uniref:DOMON-like domain-containing protein n=1 Tax=Sphingomonas suaedae TaxID=2599297 RepID=A0A518RET8_9SPHN|nr:DOMON-like domain-containing protein [Sphingomonas suaedae]QDX25990.1 DOMON-like domain-containing protein [Sphingomonas suaedae]